MRKAMNAASSSIGSESVACLQAVWLALRRLEPAIPDAAMVVFAAGLRRGAIGHFAGHRWRSAEAGPAHEIAIHPHLFRTPHAALETLVHEAAHATLWERGQHGGCRPGNPRYHNRLFRDEAMRLGLNCSNRTGSGRVDTNRGWTWTSWPGDQVPDRYLPALEILTAGLRWHTELDCGRSAQRPAGHRRMSCGCPRAIYLSENCAKLGAIRCESCQGLFLPS